MFIKRSSKRKTRFHRRRGKKLRRRLAQRRGDTRKMQQVVFRKKVSKLDSASSKSLNSEVDANGSFDDEKNSPDMTESKQKGKGKLLSRANKLRQSLSLSSRRKKIKRNGYRSYDRGLENSASNLTVYSLPEKAECRSGSETLQSEVEQDDQVNLEQDDTEADKLFSWLISPVKPGKFFRYMICTC